MELKPILYQDANLAIGTIRANFNACMQPFESFIRFIEKDADLVDVANLAKACLYDSKSRFETLCHEVEFKYIPCIRIFDRDVNDKEEEQGTRKTDDPQWVEACLAQATKILNYGGKQGEMLGIMLDTLCDQIE